MRPTFMNDAPGAGTVEIGEQVERGEISRDDVAEVLVHVLHEPETIRKAFEVGPGEIPIEEGVALQWKQLPEPAR